jgi:hypothetical protein
MRENLSDSTSLEKLEVEKKALTCIDPKTVIRSNHKRLSVIDSPRSHRQTCENMFTTDSEEQGKDGIERKCKFGNRNENEQLSHYESEGKERTDSTTTAKKRIPTESIDSFRKIRNQAESKFHRESWDTARS